MLATIEFTSSSGCERNLEAKGMPLCAGIRELPSAVTDARIPSTMPSYILTCESCGSHQPFIVYEEEIGALRNGEAVLRHCPHCRAQTRFNRGFPERRGGRDRRQDGDRRSSKTQ
jgi:hypothetical protein